MTEQCPCGRPLDPTVFHDDDDQGRPLCVAGVLPKNTRAKKG